MPDALFLVIGFALAAWLVLLPLWRDGSEAASSEEPDVASLRHRVALEALRDVETDRHAGSLDDAAYAEQLAEAEERAAATRAALESPAPAAPGEPSLRGRRMAIAAAGLIGAVLLAGSFVPASGIASRTIVNQPLAEALAAEDDRQAQIAELIEALGENPRDTKTLSALADAHLAGPTQDDLVRAAVALQLIIELEPGRVDAYERIMGAYVRAGDYINARRAHDAYAELDTADPVEAAFFDGIIALRGEDDGERALAAFDRFLELAPGDPRAAMIGGLRDEASEAVP